MMEDISVAEYDDAEKQAISEAPNYVLRAYRPVTFEFEGMPTRVRHVSELSKFVDYMDPLRFDLDFSRDMGGLTEDEFDLWKQLTTQINRFADVRFGRKALARGSVLSAVGIFRHIRFICGDAVPRILEIGPGSGYLGATFILSGYPYAATDITQALYLHQNHFWNFISNGDVHELARTGSADGESDTSPPKNVVHYPWWEFLKLTPESVPEFDIVTCNHALAELQRDSLKFMLTIARASLRGPGPVKAFVFQSWGGRLLNALHEVIESFYRAGFALVHYDPLITIMAPIGTENGVDFFPVPNKPVKKRLEILARNSLRRLTGEPRLFPNKYDLPSGYTSRRNPLSLAIISGRRSQRDLKTVGADQVNRFYSDLVGSNDHFTRDERFNLLLRGVNPELDPSWRTNFRW